MQKKGSIIVHNNKDRFGKILDSIGVIQKVYNTNTSGYGCSRRELDNEHRMSNGHYPNNTGPVLKVQTCLQVFLGAYDKDVI